MQLRVDNDVIAAVNVGCAAFVIITRLSWRRSSGNVGVYTRFNAVEVNIRRRDIFFSGILLLTWLALLAAVSQTS